MHLNNNQGEENHAYLASPQTMAVTKAVIGYITEEAVIITLLVFQPTVLIMSTVWVMTSNTKYPIRLGYKYPLNYLLQ